MTKEDKKLLFKFLVVCATTDKRNLFYMYFALKDLFFYKVLHRTAVCIPFNFYSVYYGVYDKLSTHELFIVYGALCRCCYMRKVKCLFISNSKVSLLNG